jgi:hypothetical protein
MATSSSTASKEPSLPLLKIREVAKILAVSRQSVRALIESGDLDARGLHPTGKKMKREHKRITCKSLAKFYKKRFNHELDGALIAKA